MKMARLAIASVEIAHQFEAYVFTGDDGYPTSKVFSPVGVTLEDGRQFILPQGRFVRDDEGFVGYVARYQVTGALLDRIRAAGTIDPDLWIEVQPIDLEEEFGFEAAQRERDDAMAGY
jgi:hypothetical protein